jgi:hypothetical protein
VTRSLDGRGLEITHQPLDADRAVTPGVTTGGSPRFSTDALDVGVWEHSAGVSTDVEADEVFVVLEGRGRVRFDDGTLIDLSPGTVGLLRAGDRTTWEIDEPLRKVWVMARTPH